MNPRYFSLKNWFKVRVLALTWQQKHSRSNHTVLQLSKQDVLLLFIVHQSDFLFLALYQFFPCFWSKKGYPWDACIWYSWDTGMTLEMRVHFSQHWTDRWLCVGLLAATGTKPLPADPSRQQLKLHLSLGQELQKEYPGQSWYSTNLPHHTSFLTFHLAGMWGYQQLNSITLHRLLPRRMLNWLHLKKKNLTTEPSILGPLNKSRASIITPLSQFLPALTKSK